VLETQVLGTRTAVERVESAVRYPDADRVDLTRVAVLVPPLPGMSVACGSGSSGRASGWPASGTGCRGRTLFNQHLRVRARSAGSIDITSKNGTRLRRALNLLAQRDEGDTYTASLRGPVMPLAGPVHWRVLARGPLLAALEGIWAARDATVRLLVELRHAEPFVRFRLDLDNHGSNRRIRARVPVGVAPHALAGAPFGFERRRRSTDAQWLEEQVVPTAPAQRFVSAAGAQGGAALLAPGHMEYELDQHGDLLLTVLRSVGDLSRGDLPERPGHAAWPTPVPGAQCRGASTFSFALMPCTPVQADDPVLLARTWEEAFLGPFATWYRGRGGEPPADTSIELSGHGLAVSAVMPAPDGDATMLRAVNLTDRDVAGSWRMTPGPDSAWRARADGTRVAPLEIMHDRIPFRAGPRELVSILVT